MHTNAPVEVFLTDVKNLAVIFGGISEFHELACAFLAEMRDFVKKLLSASSRMEGMTINQLLDRTRVIMKDQLVIDEIALPSNFIIKAVTGFTSNC